MGVSATIRPGITATYTKTKGYGLATWNFTDHPILSAIAVSFADGTGLGNADLMWVTNPVSPPTIAASSFVDIDLNGTTPDSLGDSLALAKVKAILVYADPANSTSNDLVIGGAASNPFIGPFNSATFKQNVTAGGFYLAVNPGAGWTVTPGTADLLRIANGAGTNIVTYHAMIIGTSV